MPTLNNFIASLPWYDTELTKQALDGFWQVMAESLRKAGIENVPSTLQRHRDLAMLWSNPQLVLSQCCGPDLFTSNGTGLEAFARPMFANLECEPGYYYSHIVSRKGFQHQPARIAVNSLSSRSGYTALIEWMDSYGVDVSAVQISGSHQNSLQMLESGRADIAAIDAHSWQQFDTRPSLPVIGRSKEALAPPYVFHRDCGLSCEHLFAALALAVKQKGELIDIVGVVRCNRENYRAAGMAQTAR